MFGSSYSTAIFTPPHSCYILLAQAESDSERMGVLAESLCDLGEEIETLEQQIAQLQTSSASASASTHADSRKGAASGGNEITRADIEALVRHGHVTDDASVVVLPFLLDIPLSLHVPKYLISMELSTPLNYLICDGSDLIFTLLRRAKTL